MAAELIGLLLSRLSLGADTSCGLGCAGSRDDVPVGGRDGRRARRRSLRHGAGQPPILYALAYTLELAFPLSSYFASEPIR